MNKCYTELSFNTLNIYSSNFTGNVSKACACLPCLTEPTIPTLALPDLYGVIVRTTLMSYGDGQGPASSVGMYSLPRSPNLGVLLPEVLFLFHSVYNLVKYKVEQWISQIIFKLHEIR